MPTSGAETEPGNQSLVCDVIHSFASKDSQALSIIWLRILTLNVSASGDGWYTKNYEIAVWFLSVLAL